MSALLSYAIRITHTARSSIQRTIRDAPLEEALQKKIAEQECYTELVEIILGAITDLSDTCDVTKEHKTYVEKINGMIEFMREKGVKPGCKTLTRETTYSDFIYTGNNTETMKSARDIANSKMKGNILEAILLPKVPRPWIIASTHEFCTHQGRDRCYNKIRATYYWSSMKNDICQAISNCKICTMESPNLGKYMNLHLEIGTAPMHFLTMDTIEIRDADSAYKYTFTLIDMLTNYVFIIPVKDICGKTLVHEYIYKVYLPFGRMEKFPSDNSTSFINKHWKNLAKALAFTHIQSSLRNPRANGRIENVHNFLKRSMKKIRHSDKTIKWHEAIRIAAHYYNTFPSASHAHSPFLLHFGRECSNPLWNKLNQGNTILRQGDLTTSVHELHKLWKAHAAEIRKNRSKKDSSKIDKDPPLKLGDRVLIMNYNSHGLDPKFFGDWKIWKFNSDRQVVVQNLVGDLRTLSTWHVKCITCDEVIFLTCDLFKPSWNL